MPGVDVDGGAGPITVTTTSVTTTGPNSPARDIDRTGLTTVTAAPVSTTGPGSTGIEVDGGTGPIAVVFTTVTTRGNDSPGVDVTGEGSILVDAGVGSTPGAFTLDTQALQPGLISYSLAYDAAAADYTLSGTPDAQDRGSAASSRVRRCRQGLSRRRRARGAEREVLTPDNPAAQAWASAPGRGIRPLTS